MDVYRGVISAEKRFDSYALFVSFFPEIVIGPIDRGDSLLKQISDGQVFELDTLKRGVLLLSWGYFQKLVIADRIGQYVDAVYSDLNTFAGAGTLVVVLMYSMQIYLDFSGCTNIARGVGYMLGFHLPENFKQPYFATGVAQFWSRWHMSLTNWFRDYVYIPLGGNRKGKTRKYINIMIVFLLSGIWHGNGLQFVVWGVLNGAFQVTGDCLKGFRKGMLSILKLDSNCICIRGFRIMFTYLLISFTWIFFRAADIREAIQVIGALFHNWTFKSVFGSRIYDFVFTDKNWYLLLFLLLAVFIIDCLQNRQACIMNWILRHGFALQLLIAYGLIFGTVILGIYGSGYQKSDFIYRNF